MKLFTLLIVLFLGTANAGWREDCKSDIQKQCPHIKSKKTFEIYSCLTEFQTNLNLDCSSALSKLKTAVTTAEQRCQDDLQKFCPTVSPGRGQWLKCLRGKNKELTPFCRNSLDDVAHEGL